MTRRTDQIRTAILGGTFDPPHIGHMMMAANVLRSGLADEVWMMVSPENPFKEGKSISPEEQRLEMARLAAEALPGLRVSDFEFSLPRPSYSAETLRRLAEKYPDRDFRIVIGADNWLEFRRWKEPEVILSCFGLVVCPRPGEELPDDFLPLDHMPDGWRGRVDFLRDQPQVLLSSSAIRKMVREGKSVACTVAPAVEAYILEHNLYTE